MKKSIKWLWILFIGGILIFNLLIFAIDKGFLGYMPNLRELENPRSVLASEIYSGNGGLIGKYYLEYREPCTYAEISSNVVNALVSTEDERFYTHSGIDAEAIGRAIKGVATFDPSGGASTISQQLAKQLLKQGSQNFIERLLEKLKEQIVAVKLERNLTKEEIMTLYLNIVPFGNNAFGIKAASKVYFNKLPSELKIEEAAVLVGLLKGNTIYNPLSNNPKKKAATLIRRNTVLNKMEETGRLNHTVCEQLKASPIVTDHQRIEDYEDMPAPYFRQVVEHDVKEWCKKNGKNLYKDGLKIYTTIDTTMQKYAEQAMLSHLPYLSRGRGTWRWAKKPKYFENIMKQTDRYILLKAEGLAHEKIMDSLKRPVKMKMFTWNNKNYEKDTTLSPIDSVKIMRAYVQCGFLAMDPASGEVKAWVGGINHKYFKYDHCNYDTRRQVGSTIKPILYCLAVDNGYSPCSPVSCAPVFFPGHRLYNAGGSSFGSMPMQKVLAFSVNNGALYLLKQVGIKNFTDFCVKCGIKSKNIKEYPSIALGAFEISMLEMIRSYTMFPNYGINTKPIYITRIEDANGNLLENFVPERKEVINEITAYKMIRMMQGTTSYGTGKALKPKYGVSGEVAGKTGTTNDEADAWFIGYTPQLVAGCWVGCEDRFMGLGIGEGSKAAMPVFGRFLNLVQRDGNSEYNKYNEFEEPLSMEGLSICDAVDKNTQIRSKYSKDNIVRRKPSVKKKVTPKRSTSSSSSSARDVPKAPEPPSDVAPSDDFR
jgi:penicillin-binding protein 1A